MNKNVITEEGYQLIKKRIGECEKESKEIADRLSYARLDGDLSENADWIALRENLEKSHDKVNKLRYLLENSEIVSEDNKKNSEFVQLGSKVSYQVFEGKEQFANNDLQVEITSEIDSDPFVGKVSYQSPLGSALLSKKVGDTVVVSNSTKGCNTYKIKILAIE